MARTPRTKTSRLDALAGHADPRAPLDAAALLAAARPVLARLEADLRARAAASPAVSRALEERHAAERAAQRTADSLAAWTDALATQVAAAWLLSCVFVRTLEDRGLLRTARLAGPGALDSQRLFFQLAPSLNERDYLLTVFRELASHPAARDLFDAEHSLVWKLSPSAGMAKELLALFRTPSADAPAFRFGQASTRFLGDLYQDLSEDVRKRYALLQTPDFVEAFILDRTLEPALARFGLDDTTVIDPTCGSGHFLLGAFDRLFERRLLAEPGVDRRVAATKALAAVHGADINPYAVAIARFRLTLAYLEKAGYARLADAPTLPLKLVVADSLLHNPQRTQGELGQVEGQSAGVWGGKMFAVEDEAAAREVLGKQYAAVVGNPPYITPKDAKLRELYRKLYRSASMQYSLSAPFAERFFQLARPSGFVGQITANSFMKREFGKKLIEEYLPGVNLELIVNTSGAYIPGHGTPTVLLFGTHDAPKSDEVAAVLAKRGEPTTPAEPAKGLVWTSVVDHWNDFGFENDFISVARIDRRSLGRHPWSLGGGGTGELKALLEERAERLLGSMVVSIGRVAHTGNDEAFVAPKAALARAGLPEKSIAPFVEGEILRDWSLGESTSVVFPYDADLSVAHESAVDPRLKYLWPYRSMLWERREPNGTHREIGLTWYEFSRFHPERFTGPCIAFAFVATHNHFVLDRGGKVFKQSAPIIKLPASATEDDHLALLAYLNSSTACFWMKQVFYPKGTHSEARPEKGIPEENRYEFAGTGLRDLPIPPLDEALVRFGRQLEQLASKRASLSPSAVIATAIDAGSDLEAALATAERYEDDVLRRMVAVQEDLDWHVYRLFALAPDSSCRTFSADARLEPSRRPFNRLRPMGLCAEDDRLWQARQTIAETERDLLLIENAVMKRSWQGSRGVFGTNVATYRERGVDASKSWLASWVEDALRQATEACPLPSLDESMPTSVCRLIDRNDEVRVVARHVIGGEAVPFLSALTYSEAGLEKHDAWQRAWEAQRLEDAGQASAATAPPKFVPADFQRFEYWSQRGKLDVPKERFISYPGCESDEDGEPLYGWAGWNHLQRAQALAALYLRRRDADGWPRDRLTPMLAGLHELIPWLLQWHNEPSADFDGLRMGDYFQQFLSDELRKHSLTPTDLRAWRPAKKTKRRPAKPPTDEPPKPRKPRKPRAAQPNE